MDDSPRRCSGRGRVLHHGPEEADKFEGHGDRGDPRLFPEREVAEQGVEPVLRLPGVGHHRRGLGALPDSEGGDDVRPMAVAPGRLGPARGGSGCCRPSSVARAVISRSSTRRRSRLYLEQGPVLPERQPIIPGERGRLMGQRV